MKKIFVLTAIVAATLAGSATGTNAQEVRKNYLAINPIGAVFQWYSFEGEHAMSPGVTLGATLSHAGFEEDDDFGGAGAEYTSADAKLRYYPSEKTLHGFSLGLSLGYSRLSGSFTTDEGTNTDHASAMSTGVLIDYNWLLGSKQRVLIGTGIGAKRLWGLDVSDGDVTPAYPTVRFVVGYAF